MNLILASKSPRRQELLRGMGFSFEILLRETDESYPDGLSPREVALYIAEKKARVFEEDEMEGKLLITRSEEHTSELQSLMRISYAVFCLKKKKTPTNKIKYSMCIEQKP